MLTRTALTFVFLLSFATTALADVAPDPYEPRSPFFWVAIMAVVAAIAGFFVHRRRRK